MATGRRSQGTATRNNWGGGANVHIDAVLLVVQGRTFQFPELKRLIDIHSDVEGRIVHIHLLWSPAKRFGGRMRAGRSGGRVRFALLEQETF
jgi:hypothetical protein